MAFVTSGHMAGLPSGLGFIINKNRRSRRAGCLNLGSARNSSSYSRFHSRATRPISRRSGSGKGGVDRRRDLGHLGVNLGDWLCPSMETNYRASPIEWQEERACTKTSNLRNTL
jgi:hypothetical protein